MDWKKQRLDRKSAMFMLKFSCDFFRFICRFEDIPSPVPSHSMTYMMNMYLRKLFLVVNGPKPSGSMSWLETVNAIRTDVGNSPLIKLLVELLTTHPQFGHLLSALDIVVMMIQTVDRMIVRMFRIYNDMSSGIDGGSSERNLFLRHHINAHSYSTSAVEDVVVDTWSCTTGIPSFLVFATYEDMRQSVCEWLEEEDPDDTDILERMRLEALNTKETCCHV